MTPARDRVGEDDAVAASQPSPARTARAGVAVAFALAGITFASWASRIPDVVALLGLSPAALGVLLLCGSAGSVLALPLSGMVAAHLGTANAVRYGAMVALTAVAGVGISTGVLRSVVLTAVFLFVTTAGIGAWDVSMNLQAATVEQALGSAVMPLLHAAFSLGTVAGAVVGTGATYLGVPIPLHLALVAAAAVPTMMWGVRRFLPDPAPHGGRGRGAARRTAAAWREPRVLAVGMLVLVSAFAEGTANDWLSLALITGHGVPPWAGTAGLAVFLIAMTIGRIVGGPLLDRFGRVRVVGVTFGLATAGALLVGLGSTLAAYAGAALWGLGASLGFPVGMSAAADEPEHAAARVSVVATIGYVAFLAGPPVLGLVGEHAGVLRAVMVVGMALAPALVLLPALRPVGTPATIPADPPA